MKKALLITGIVILSIALVVGSLVIWQWDNIKSVYLGLTETALEIETRRAENQEALVFELNEYMDTPVREMTPEEKKQVENGEKTVTEVYSEIFTELEKGTVENSRGEIPEKLPSGSVSQKDAIIAKYMAQLYNLQSEYSARAESTISQGDRYYESIKSHPQDATARAKTIAHFTPIVRSVEAECDGKVENVIANLEKELKTIGANTDIIGTIRTTYAKEKQLKLSYYSNKYLS